MLTNGFVALDAQYFDFAATVEGNFLAHSHIHFRDDIVIDSFRSDYPVYRMGS